MGDSHASNAKFMTLDGLRGVAAILVVGRHAGALGYTSQESFLAVDLFFCLSGFVVAMAYDQRLAEGGYLGRFVRTRWIRLYPLYFLGLALGLAAAFFSGTPILAPAVIAGVLMLPQNPWMLGAVGTFNQPVWTLPLELFANLLYAVFHRFLTLPVLIGIAALSAGGLVWSASIYGEIDLGWAPNQLGMGFSRLFFSFTVGAILARTIGDRRRHRPIVAWLCIAAAEAMLLFQPPDSLRIAYELAAILIGFPALILVACQSEPSRGAATLFGFGGLISYAVYTLHAPLAHIATLAAEALGHSGGYGRIEMGLFMVALVGAAWLADRYYDHPVRTWLTARLVRRQRAGTGPVEERTIKAWPSVT
jgi:peptidoglycan/LPS O-acetylase OafA/YrhL